MRKKKQVKRHTSQRARFIAHAIHLTYDSLQSHLPYVFDAEVPKSEQLFHKRCVKEYALLIWYISQLY